MAASVRRTNVRVVLAAVVAGAGGVSSVLAGCDEPPTGQKTTQGTTGSGASQTPKEQPKAEAKAPPKGQPEKPAREKVTIGGKDFKLEPALDDPTRFKGLSGRESIDADGGMLFVFTQPRPLYFVMRDCPIPIDIIFLDATGRVTATHKMVPEEPRTDEEKKLDPDGVNAKYEARLKRYSSRYDAQFVIELKGNTLDSLNVKEGDQVKLDVAALKKRAS